MHLHKKLQYAGINSDQELANSEAFKLWRDRQFSMRFAEEIIINLNKANKLENVAELLK